MQKNSEMLTSQLVLVKLFLKNMAIGLKLTAIFCSIGKLLEQDIFFLGNCVIIVLRNIILKKNRFVHIKNIKNS